MHVNVSHPLLSGALSWWYALPSRAGGAYFPDLLDHYHGTRVGAAWVGGVIDFTSASSQYVECGDLGNSIDGASEVTLLVWGRRKAANNNVAVGKGGTGTTFDILGVNAHTDGNVYHDVGAVVNSAYGFYAEPSNGPGWHQYGFVFDGTLTGDANRLKAYYDGLPRTLTFGGGSSIPAVTPATANTFKVGKHYTSFASAQVQSVTLWTRALPASLVYEHYAQHRAGQPALLSHRRPGAPGATAFDACLSLECA